MDADQIEEKYGTRPMKQLEMFEDPREQSVTSMVREFAETAGQKTNVTLARDLIREEYKECEEEWNDSASRPENELKELADLIYVVYGYARHKGYDLKTAVERVHKNNMGRMFQPDGTIHRRDDGKILKNKDYPKVNLKDLVGE